MSWVDALRYRLRTALRADAASDELREEIDFHVALERRDGRMRDDVASLRENVRRQWRPVWIDALARDLGWTWRRLIRHPRFVLATLVTLGLGLASATIVFTFAPAFRDAGGGDPRFAIVLTTMQGVGAALIAMAAIGAAQLLIARTASQRAELAIREMLGASRADVVRQRAIDVVILVSLAGTVAYVVAGVAVNAISRVLITDLSHASRIGPVTVRPSVVITLGLVAAIAVGAMLGVRRSRPLFSHIGNAYLAAQIALTLVIVATAGWMVRSAHALSVASVGISIGDVWTMRIRFAPSAEAADRRRWFVGADSIRNVGFVSHVPLGNADTSVAVISPDGRRIGARLQRASTSYFATLSIPLLRGRGFAVADTMSDVAIINRTFARTIGGDVIGRSISIGKRTRTIVGVVDDVHHNGADTRPTMEVYLPMLERPDRQFDAVFVARDEIIASATRDDLARVDPNADITPPRSMAAVASARYAGNRLVAALLSVFATVALIVTAGMLYASLAREIANREREVGIRVALGANAIDRLATIAAPLFAPVSIGLAFGLAGVLIVGAVLEPVTFGIRVRDVVSLMGSLGAFLATALGCIAPLVARLVRIDPMRALREAD